MTAMLSTPRLDLLDRLVAADLEVEQMLEQFQFLDRRLGRAHRAMGGPDTRTPLGQAHLRQVEGEYEEALGQLRDARRRVQALCRLD